MNNKSKGKIGYLPLLLLLLLLLFLAGTFLLVSRAVSDRIVDSNSETLIEFSEHDRKQISSGISMRVRQIEALAEMISGDRYSSTEEMMSALNRYSVLVAGADQVYYLASDANAYKSSGAITSEKELYDAFLDAGGKSFVTRYNTDRPGIIENRKERFIVGVPADVTVGRTHFVCLAAPYSLSTLEEDLKVESFGGEGYSSLIDSNGNYILNISRTHIYGKADNLFDELNGAKYDGFAGREDILAAADGGMVKVSYEFEGEEYLMVLSPMEGTDWYFVSMVPVRVFEKQSSAIMQIFVSLLAAVLVAVAVLALFVLRQRKQEEKLRRAELVERQNEELEKKERELEEALTIADYLVSSFVSAYYIDLKTHQQSVYLRNEELHAKYDGIDSYLESVSKYIAEDVHPDDRETMFLAVQPTYIRERLKTEESFVIPFRDISGGVKKYYRYIIIRGADDDHVAMAFSDATEEVRAEKEQQRKLADALSMAQEASEAKSSFLFNMSHDIRTPMNAITGFTGMAIKHIDDKEKVLDCLDKTQKAGSMLLTLINNVLEVSRIESGHASVEQQEGDIYLCFNNIETTMQELAVAKDIKLSFRFGDIYDRFVFADYGRCMRIFVNIISNAIKYTPEGGRVDVRCEQVAPAKSGSAVYRYTFTDNGIGMSEEFQKHIFDQFSREQNSTVSGIQGTGLGMSVVKSFVDLMDGRISFTSKLGEGTTFVVELPFRVQTEKIYTDPETGLKLSADDAGRDRTESFSFSGRKVLLVEDNELNREIATEILEEEGMTVESAEDGTKAVELVNERGPEYYDFVLMDIQMPMMNGYEATRIIRETYPDTHVPIIALSANAFEEDRQKSLEAGMDDHVAKPIDVVILKETLAKYL